MVAERLDIYTTLLCLWVTHIEDPSAPGKFYSYIYKANMSGEQSHRQPPTTRDDLPYAYKWACDYLSMLGLKSIHVSKRDHRWQRRSLSTRAPFEYKNCLSRYIGKTFASFESETLPVGISVLGFCVYYIRGLTVYLSILLHYHWGRVIKLLYIARETLLDHISI